MGYLKITCFGCLKQLVDEEWDDVKTKEEFEEFIQQFTQTLTGHLSVCSNPSPTVPFSIVLKS